MSVEAFRLSLRAYQERAFSGEGARRAGGRWNPRGLPAVYASSSLSLAVLEFLVHLGAPHNAPDLVYYRISVEETLVERARLVRRWNEWSLARTREMGRRWLEQGSTPILAVPSFVVPAEWNYVLNPHHRDFSKIGVEGPLPFALDVRLWKPGERA